MFVFVLSLLLCLTEGGFEFPTDLESVRMRFEKLSDLMARDPIEALTIIKRNLESTEPKLLWKLWSNGMYKGYVEIPISGVATLATTCSLCMRGVNCTSLGSQTCSFHARFPERTYTLFSDINLPSYPLRNVPVHGFALGSHLVLLEDVSLDLNPSDWGSASNRTDYLSICLTISDCASSLSASIEQTKFVGSGNIGAHYGNYIHWFSDDAARTSAKFHFRGQTPTWRDIAASPANYPVFKTDANCIRSDFSNTNAPGTLGTNLRWLMMRVDFADHTGVVDCGGTAYGSTQFTDSLTAIAAHVARASFGRYTIDVAASVMTPVMRITSTTWANFVATGDWPSILFEARSQAAALGFHYCDFAMDMVLTSCVSTFSYAGMAYVGGRGGHLNGNGDCTVWLHESGHNLGLTHAQFAEPVTASTESFLINTIVEYGDLFDTMGTSWGLCHEAQFQALYKQLLGWVDQRNLRDATNLDADVDLAAVDSDMTSAEVASQTVALLWTRPTPASLSTADGTTLAWESEVFSHREMDFSAVYGTLPRGLQHHIKRSPGQGLLVDHAPGTTSALDAALPLGQTYSDCMQGFHLTPLKYLACSDDASTTCLRVAVRYGVEYGDVITIAFDPPAPLSARVGSLVSIDAEAMSSAGRRVSVTWELADGTMFVDQPRLSVVFARAGPTLLRVTAKDYLGGFASYAFPITITDDSAVFEAVDVLALAAVGTSLSIDNDADKLTVSYAALPAHSDAWSLTLTVTFASSSLARVLLSKGHVASVWAELDPASNIVTVRAQPTVADANSPCLRPSPGASLTLADPAAELHVALVASAAGVALYLNGELAQYVSVGAGQVLLADSEPLVLGGLATDLVAVEVVANQHFDGVYFPVEETYGGYPVYRQVGNDYLFYANSETSWILGPEVGGGYYTLVSCSAHTPLENTGAGGAAGCTWSNGAQVAVSRHSQSFLGGSMRRVTFVNYALSATAVERYPSIADISHNHLFPHQRLSRLECVHRTRRADVCSVRMPRLRI